MFRRGVLGLLVFWITSVYAQSAVPCRCTNEAFDSLCSTTATGGGIIERYVGSDVPLDCGAPSTIRKRQLAADISSGLIEFDTSDNSKYSIDSSVLTIRNIGPDDEGVYECSTSSKLFCLLVVHNVEFQACSVPNEGTCEATVQVVDGDLAVFNTHITFGQSECNCRQQLLSLSFLSVLSGNESIHVAYLCEPPIGNCRNVTGVIEMHDGTPSNFSLRIPNPLSVENNGSRFMFIVTGPRSGGSGRRSVEAFFTILIVEPPPTTASTEVPTTTSMSLPPDDHDASVIVGVIFGVLLLILLAVGGVVVALYVYRRFIKHHAITKSGPEPLYTDVEDIKRGSRVYSSWKGQTAPPDLSTTLESVSVSA